MRPLRDLSPETFAQLEGLVFDLDDTVLDHGLLTGPAHDALLRAHAHGIRLILATGRPAGWADVLARIWPLDGAIAENGAAILYPPQAGAPLRPLPPAAQVRSREEQCARVQRALAALQSRYEIRLADDNDLRRYDVAIDVNETVSTPPERVQELIAFAQEQGVRALASSIHVHLFCEAHDKASSVLRLLYESSHMDPTAACLRYAFIGDSSNDSSCFAAFRTSVGVANVVPHLRRLSIPPAYVTEAPRGAGFAELIDAWIASKSGAPRTDVSP